MKRFDFNKHSAALKLKLRNILRSHAAAYSFKINKVYLQSIKKTLDELKKQEEQFAEFVIEKQSEIDVMEPGLFKDKMQEHLDKIVVQTHEHFNKLIDKYQWMLKGGSDTIAIDYSPN